MSKLVPKVSMSDYLATALANNDACLRLLGEGPLDTRSERGANLYRACRWHVGNDDAEWRDDEQRVCVITEAGRETLERLEWRLANPEEADRQFRDFVDRLPWTPR